MCSVTWRFLSPPKPERTFTHLLNVITRVSNQNLKPDKTGTEFLVLSRPPHPDSTPLQPTTVSALLLMKNTCNSPVPRDEPLGTLRPPLPHGSYGSRRRAVSACLRRTAGACTASHTPPVGCASSEYLNSFLDVDLNAEAGGSH